MAGQPTAVIYNPTKFTDVDALRAEVESQLRDAGWAAPTWFETSADDPGDRHARQAVTDGAEVVLACGGDGTVRACAAAVAGSQAALAVMPAGTGNLLARHLHLPSGTAAAIHVVTTGSRKRIDVGRVGEDCFTVAAGIGFDADLLADAPTYLKRTLGWPAYLVSAIRHSRGRRFRVEIRLDGAPPRRHLARSVVVTNVSELRGGLVIAPDARDDDGIFDVVVIAPRGIHDWMTAVYRAVRRSRHDRLVTYTATDIDLRVRHRRVARQYDGDPLPAGDHLRIRVEPAALEVCVP